MVVEKIEKKTIKKTSERTQNKFEGSGSGKYMA